MPDAVRLQRNPSFLNNRTKKHQYPHKTHYIYPFDYTILLAGIYPKEITRERMSNDVHLSIVYNVEKLEISEMGNNRYLAELISFQTFN